MKLPFPYSIAAEFILFQPPPRKVTLPHLCVALASIAAVGLCGGLMPKEVPWFFRWSTCGVVGLLVGFTCYRVFLLVVPLLRLLVAKRIMNQPDDQRLEEKVRSYIGGRQ